MSYPESVNPGVNQNAAGNKKRAGIDQIVLKRFEFGANAWDQMDDRMPKSLDLATAWMRLLTPNLL